MAAAVVKRALKSSKRVTVDGFTEVEFLTRDCFCLSLFIRIGWIPPKRLKSKFGVSVADRHPPTHNNN